MPAAAQVIQMSDARPQQGANASVITKLTHAYELYLAEELPKLTAAMQECDGKGGGSLTFTMSLKWNKDEQIDFQAVGNEKYPPKVLLEHIGEITGKGQLNLW